MDTDKRLAFLVIAIGLATFFVPLVSTDPPVSRTAHWSAFKIVQEMYRGNLPPPPCERCDEPVIRAFLALPFSVTLAYSVLILALVSLCFPGLPRALSWMALGAAYMSLRSWGWFGKFEFEETFYGFSVSKGHISYHSLVLANLLALVAFGLIAREISEPTPRTKPRRVVNETMREPQEPPLADAEILPPEDADRH